MRSDLSTRRGRTLGFLFDLTERVEEVYVELMEWKRWREIVGAIWISVFEAVSGPRGENSSSAYFSSRSSSASSCCSGTISSESMASTAPENGEVEDSPDGSRQRKDSAHVTSPT